MIGGTVPPISEYRRQIEAALAHNDGSHTFEDVAQGVELGEMQYWPGEKSVIITEIGVFPRYKYLNVFLAGGDMAEIERMAAVIEGWAITQGCTREQLVGREGWGRTFLTRDGWVKKSVVFEKKLNVGK